MVPVIIVYGSVHDRARVFFSGSAVVVTTGHNNT